MPRSLEGTDALVQRRDGIIEVPTRWRDLCSDPIQARYGVRPARQMASLRNRDLLHLLKHCLCSAALHQVLKLIGHRIHAFNQVAVSSSNTRPFFIDLLDHLSGDHHLIGLISAYLIERSQSIRDLHEEATNLGGGLDQPGRCILGCTIDQCRQDHWLGSGAGSHCRMNPQTQQRPCPPELGDQPRHVLGTLRELVRIGPVPLRQLGASPLRISRSREFTQVNNSLQCHQASLGQLVFLLQQALGVVHQVVPSPPCDKAAPVREMPSIVPLELGPSVPARQTTHRHNTQEHGRHQECHSDDEQLRDQCEDGHIHPYHCTQRTVAFLSSGICQTHMRITRRHLIALGSATAAVGVVGVGVTLTHWWDQPAGAAFVVLSEEEADFIRALAGTAYPRVADINLSGETAKLEYFFDQMLHHMPEEPRQLLRLLLHGLDSGTVLSRGSTFTHLLPVERTEVLEGWLHNDLAELRNAGQSIVLLLGMGWTTHPAVVPRMALLHSCGYGT